MARKTIKKIVPKNKSKLLAKSLAKRPICRFCGNESFDEVWSFEPWVSSMEMLYIDKPLWSENYPNLEDQNYSSVGIRDKSEREGSIRFKCKRCGVVSYSDIMKFTGKFKVMS